MKVWITKYAMSSGVFTAEAEETSIKGVCAVRPKESSSSLTAYYHGNDWHTNEAKAVIRFNQMKQKKIASLKKQLAKVEALTFSPRESEA